jgi:hypothetical protein
MPPWPVAAPHTARVQSQLMKRTRKASRALGWWITGVSVVVLAVVVAVCVSLFQLPSRPLRRLPVSGAWTLGLVEMFFSPDGRWLAAWDGALVWDTTTWQLVFQRGKGAQANGFSAGGRRMLTVEKKQRSGSGTPQPGGRSRCGLLRRSGTARRRPNWRPTAR